MFFSQSGCKEEDDEPLIGGCLGKVTLIRYFDTKLISYSPNLYQNSNNDQGVACRITVTQMIPLLCSLNFQSKYQIFLMCAFIHIFKIFIETLCMTGIRLGLEDVP